MAGYAFIAVLIAAGALLAVFARYRRRATVDATRPVWGVTRVSEADPYADEFWRFATAGSAPPDHAIDDRTWNDLDLDEVLQRIDRTRTTLGRQILYASLRGAGPPLQRRRVDELAGALFGDGALRAEVTSALDGLDPATGQNYWRITRQGALQRRSWYYIFPVLTLVTVSFAVLVFVKPAFILGLAVALLASAGVRAATSRDMMGYRSAFRQIAPILRAARRLDRFGAGADEESASDSAALAMLERTAGWMSRDPLEVGELVATAHEYLNLLLLIDANALHFSSRALERAREALVRASVRVGEADLAMSIASVRAESPAWTAPVFDDSGGALEIVGMWHPMIAEPVANSVILSPGAGIIVTGSNMSGKSTFLRTVGVCAAFANGIRMCPAASFRAPVLRLRTCIGRADSIAEGRSYYLAEVERVLEIVRTRTLPGRHLLLFDELFRGTNTIERIAAGEAVLRELLATPSESANVIVATHDGELVALLADTYDAMHFEERVTPEGLAFDYQLRPGPSTTRSAITLLELCGAPRSVVDSARARVDSLMHAAEANIR
jgi:hypothetical protein